MSARPTRIERQAYDWLAKMLDDPGRNAAPLERWLAKDPENRAVYRRIAVEIGRASDSAARIPSLRVASSSPVAHRRRSGSGRMVAIAGLSAVIAAAAGVLGVHHGAWRDVTLGAGSSDEARTYQTAASGETVRLVDGSAVALFGSSEMVTHYTSSERGIDLVRGGGRFVVSHNAARPFIVYAAGGKVTATGTVFEVAMAQGVRVRLLSGMVDVNLPRSTEIPAGRIVRLHPGQQLAYRITAAKPQPTAEAPTTARAIAVESFDDIPAERIAEKVNQRSATKILFADPALGQRQVFGDLNLDDANAVAQKLAALLGLAVDRSQAGRLILKSPK